MMATRPVINFGVPFSDRPLGYIGLGGGVYSTPEHQQFLERLANHAASTKSAMTLQTEVDQLTTRIRALEERVARLRAPD